MRKLSFLIVLLVLGNSFLFAQQKILVITGGHDFEKKEFFEMFDSFKEFSYDWIEQPIANEQIYNKNIGKYQALIFYDMYQEITEAQKDAYLDRLKEGKGMVFLHHSLVSYQEWPEFQDIIGGKYLLKETADMEKSTYEHDVDFIVEIADSNKHAHSIIKDLKDFQLHDEVYGKFIVNNNVSPLIKTRHPNSTEIIGWAHQYKKSRIVYLQPGHDHHAYQNENYKKLVLNSIKWVIGTEN